MRNKLLYILVVLAVLFSSVPAVLPAMAQDGEGDNPPPPISTVDLPPPERGEPVNAKLDTQLNALVSGKAAETASALTAQHTAGLAEGYIRVIVECAPGQADAAIDTAVTMGAEFDTGRDDRFQMSIPVSSLSALAESPDVSFIRLPFYAEPYVTSEGVALMNADDWQVAGLTGAGVKIGILDVGFSGYDSLLGTELPAAVTTRSFLSGGDIYGPSGYPQQHGTACAEVVHDVAPGAQLYLVNYGNEVEILDAIDYLIYEAQVDIVTHSCGHPLWGPGNGSGPVCNKIAEARSNGIFWSQSMGNYGQSHWWGNWVDSYPNNYLEYYSNWEFCWVYLYPSYPLNAYLKWNDPWGTSSNDYDMYLFSDSTGQWVDGSEQPQNGTGGDDYPYEYIGYTAPSEGWYGLAVYKYSATTPETFHLFVYPYDLGDEEVRVALRSISVPADSLSAVSLGAVPWNNPTTIESFSSQGPTDNGNIKPDLVAPDNVSNSVYTTFPGTSASTPHVAGAAALVMERYPAYTPAQIQTFLESNAVPLGAPGKDNLFGSGRLYLGDAPPTGSISGYVRDNIGNDISTALVVAAAYGKNELLLVNPDGQATTAGDGYYQITGLPVGDYRVCAVASGFERVFYNGQSILQNATAVPVTVGGNTGPIDFQLNPGGTISGTIIDQTTQLPISNVSVCAAPFGVIGISSATLTDPQGNYMLDGLAYGPYQVSAPLLGPSDGNYIMEFYQEKRFYESYTPVTVADGVNPDDIDFTLEEGGTVSGNIVNESLQPVPGVVVFIGDYATRTGTWQIYGIGKTNPGGSYQTTGVPAGQQAVKVQVAPGYALEWYDDVHAAVSAAPVTVSVPGEVNGIDFVLGPGATISGQVTATVGSAPVPGARVEVVKYDTIPNVSGWQTWGEAFTDANGEYTTSGVPAGQYSLRVSSGTYISEWWDGDTHYYGNEAVPITLATTNLQGYNFNLEAGGFITGHVQDANPIPNLLIQAFESATGRWINTVTTDASGDYTIPGLPAGSYWVRTLAAAQGLPYADEFYDNVYTPQFATEVPVTPPDTFSGINFTLGPGGHITGEVKAGVGGVGIPNAMIQVIDYWTRTGVWQFIAFAFTDADGNYRTPDLPLGVPFAVRVVANGYASEWYDNTYYNEDAALVDIDFLDVDVVVNLDLAPGYSISGHAQDAVSGQAIPNLHIQVFNSDNGLWMASVNTNASGDYTLSGLPAGNYWVKTWASYTGLPYIDEYYNNAYNSGEAAVVTVTTQNVSNINFSLDIVPHVPDLIVTEVHEVWAGSTYRIYFTIKNDDDETTVLPGYKVGLLPDAGVAQYVAVTASLGPNGTWSSNFATQFTVTDGSDMFTISVDADLERQESDELNNGRSITVAPLPGQPDLIVLNEWETWNGSDYTVYITLYNRGNANAAAGFDISLSADGVLKETVPVSPALAKGAARDYAFTPVTVSGLYDSVIVTADSESEVNESIEWNNTRENTLAQPPMPDLAIVFVTATPVDADTYTVSSLVRNIGNAAAGPFSLRMAVDYVVQQTVSVPVPLAPGQMWLINFAGQYDVTGYNDKLNVDVDINAEVAESREDNNSFQNIWPFAEPPAVSTGQVGVVGTTSATVSGNLDSLGDYMPVYLSFVYGTVSDLTEPYNYQSEVVGAPPSRDAPGGFSGALDNLDSNTRYYYRAKATAGGVNVYGAEQHFDTLKMDPAVTTLAATGVTDRSAVLNCNVTKGDYSPVYVAFDYGTATGVYTDNTTPQAVTQSGSFSVFINEINNNNLEKNTPYFFRARVTADGITIYGNELTLNTYSNPPEVWVDDDFDDTTPYWNDLNFSAIQDAIVKVEPVVGIVHVHEGTYNGDVNVNKTLTLQSVNGATVTTIQTDSILNISAHYVTVRGFSVNGTGMDGIVVSGYSYLTVSNCIIFNCDKGILLNPASSARIVNNIIRENSTGIYIPGGMDNEVIGNSILSSTEYGIWSIPGNIIHFNNIVGNTTGGIQNISVVETLQARYNWWGDASGPGPVGTGTGDTVSEFVNFTPWLTGEVSAAASGTVTNDTLDALTETDTEVLVTGSTTVTVAQYTGNPGATFSNDIGKYIDVTNTNVGITQLEIRLYYTEAEIASKVESTLKLYWFNGTAWVACSDIGVAMDAVAGYSGYIWAKIRNDTTPALADLTGTPFGATASPRQTGGGGGGGGGGGSSDSTSLSEFITSEGRFVVDATAQSADLMVKVLIPKDTVGKDRNGGRLRYIKIKKQTDSPAAPADCEFVCFTYDITPAGATLEPFAYLVFFYQDSRVPAGVDEKNLALATLLDGVWMMLEGCVVDPDKNTITAPITHFSVYTAMASTAPAKFEIAGLTITPAAVEPDAPVTISVTVTNTGDLTGSYTVALKINAEEQTKAVTLKGDESQTVSFTWNPDRAGEYTVSVSGLSGQFTVKESEGGVADVPAEPTEPEPSPRPPSQPAEEPVTPSQPEPVEEPEEPVTTAQIPEETVPPPQPLAWWLIVVCAAGGVIVVGLIVYLFVRRRNTAL